MKSGGDRDPGDMQSIFVTVTPWKIVTVSNFLETTLELRYHCILSGSLVVDSIERVLPSQVLWGGFENQIGSHQELNFAMKTLEKSADSTKYFITKFSAWFSQTH